jgi:sigma-54 specific flagellar transcriptional regulator A
VLAPALEALARDACEQLASLPAATLESGAARLAAAVAQDDAALDDEPPAMDPRLANLLLDEIPKDFDLRNYLETLEQRLIVQAMQAAGGTVAQAARLLGLRRTTLVEKLRKYSLADGDLAASET